MQKQPDNQFVQDGDLLVGRGKYDLALTAYEQADADTPEDPTIQAKIAQCQLTLGKMDDARLTCLKWARLDSNDPTPHVNLAAIFIALGDNGNAKKHCRMALSIEPNTADAHLMIGNILVDEQEYDQAVDAYQKSIDINPDNPKIWNNLGLALTYLKRYDEAESAFYQALDKNVDYASAYFNLGNVSHARNKLEEAKTAFLKALELMPDNLDAINNLGNVYKSMKLPDKALEMYKRCLEIDPDYAKGHHNIGSLLRNYGKFDEAIPYFKKASELDPKNVHAKHLYAALSGGTAEAAPREYVRDIFDHGANDFENHLVNDLGYSTPTLMGDIFKKIIPEGQRFPKAIDLGCGTGLSGLPFADMIDQFIGIDLSRKMLDIAREKDIYQELVVDDVVDFLNQRGEKFDLFIATEVFVYLGDLSAVMKAMAKSAGKNAYLLFTTEESEEAGDYKLRHSGRFAHNAEYLRRITTENGFEVVHEQVEKLRKDRGNWIMGRICVCRIPSDD